MTAIDRGEELAKVLWYYNLIPTVTIANQKIVCPFHGDVNASLLINLSDGSWYCFGCGKSGDAFGFVKEMEKEKGLNDLQLCKRFIQILRSKQCSNLEFKKFKNFKKSGSKVLYAQAYDYYHGLSKVDWKNGSTEEVVATRDYMKKRGFTAKALHRCKAKVTYNKSYPIIFPLLDNGKFKGWVCRTNNKVIEQKRKYLYNEGFSRATTLVGNYGSKDYVFVVEGYMDRLKFVQYGEENVVAILGWKMSDDHIQKLKDKGIKYVISALDNDKCGKKGTAYISEHFDMFRFKYLKGIKDPGEMSQKQFNKMYTKTMQEFEKFRKRGK